MSLSVRQVVAEDLDNLDPEDPRALRSRRDLRRVHRAMGSLGILKRAMDNSFGGRQPHTILEIGAGDGSLLLRLARALQPPWTNVHLTLLDRQDLISDQTRAAFSDLGWTTSTLCLDVNDWVRSCGQEHYDLCCTTLFLHHFESASLGLLLFYIAAHTDTFVACEPRRSKWGRAGSHLIGCIGTNEVTRQDAVKSVAAGFTGGEIGAMWPNPGGRWQIEEYPRRAFTHCFIATRRSKA